jgi:small subunit ribosomal protein S1
MTGKDLEGMDFRMPRRRPLEVGEVVKGTVVMIGSTHVFLDVGGKSEASLDLREVADEDGEVQLKVGDTVEAYIVSTEPEIVLSYAMARSQLNQERLQDAHDLGIPVEGRVTAVNKGGLEVDLGGQRAFCPVSQIDLGYCEEPSVYLNETLSFRVTELSGRNIVVSRRALLEEERQEVAAATAAQLQEGAEFEGEVVSLKPYGAFVDVGGGIQGLVHISQIGHSRIEHPEEVLRVGQRVRVQVLRIEPDPKHPGREKISLSMKSLLGDPWQEAAALLVEGGSVTGTVVRLQPFGAFVEIAPGVDGLVHVSELSERRIRHPSEVVSEGQTVTATVLKVDRASRRISLSLLDQSNPGTEELTVGSVVDAVVNRIKPFGLLVQIKGGGKGARGLIPAEETGSGKGANLRRAFPEGTEVKAMIIAVEPDTGRLRLSIGAYTEQKERQDYSSFVADESPAKPKSGSSLGTLGDLLQRKLDESKKKGR